MNKVRFQLLGYRNFVSKANKPLTVVVVGNDCTPEDNTAGRFGLRTTEFFLPDDRVGTLKPDCLGMEFVPEYEINGFGRPSLCGFDLLPWKS